MANITDSKALPWMASLVGLLFSAISIMSYQELVGMRQDMKPILAALAVHGEQINTNKDGLFLLRQDFSQLKSEVDGVRIAYAQSFALKPEEIEVKRKAR